MSEQAGISGAAGGGSPRPRNGQEQGEALYSLPHVAFLLVAWAAVQLAIAAFHFPEALAGAQLDSDGYFRLLRVEHLLGAGSWYDNSIPGSNWPYGETIHWTRPLDVLMVLLAAPFMAWFPVEQAVAIAGSLVSPLFHAALCVAGVWVIAPLVAGPARFLVMPALLAQPGVFAYGTVGRADHHMLVLLLVFLAIGWWLRALLEPEARRPPLVAGVLMGLALWVSPEALLPLAPVFAAGGIAWVLAGRRYRASNVRFSIALAVAITVAVLVERPPGEWAAVEFDRISLAHLTMSLIAVAFWTTVARWPEARGLDARGRGLVAAIAGAAGVALLHVLHPGFFEGPAANADPRLDEIFFPLVDELQPLVSGDLTGIGEAVSYVGAFLLALPYAIVRVLRAGSLERRSGWAFLLVALVFLVPLAAGQRRLVGYAGIVLALVITSMLAKAIEWANTLDSPMRARLARLGSMVGLLLGFLLVGSVLGHVAALGDGGGGDGDAGLPSTCDVRAVSAVLSEPGGLGSPPRTIAASPNIGPELLYRTPHRILSGPYHRNHEGMGAILDLFTSTDPARAREIIRAREIGFLLLCPAFDQGYFGAGGRARDDAEPGDRPSLYRRLTEGELPDWAEPVELSDSRISGFRLFVVR